jgi:hypothetical protein
MLGCTMLGGMVLYGLFGVMRCMREVTVGDMRVMPGLYMVAGFMMLRGFAVVFGRVLMMLGCLVMMRSTLMIVHGFCFSFISKFGFA